MLHNFTYHIFYTSTFKPFRRQSSVYSFLLFISLSCLFVCLFVFTSFYLDHSMSAQLFLSSFLFLVIFIHSFKYTKPFPYSYPFRFHFFLSFLFLLFYSHSITSFFLYPSPLLSPPLLFSFLPFPVHSFE